MAKRMRLDKMLSHMGYGSRSEIKKAVKQGKVAVDGTTVKDSGIAIDTEANRVEWEGLQVCYRDIIYLMMNKPQGVISATEDTREKTVIDLLEPEDQLLQPFPVGRLDKDTEGLLLITNDGQLAHDLLSPRKHVNKTYEAMVTGEVGEQDRQEFEKGVTLDDGYVTLPAELHIHQLTVQEDGTTESFISLTIREGKFHQVKRMFEAVGKKVVYLRRVAMGPLQLDPDLPLGTYRELEMEEVEQLRSHKGHSKTAES